LERRFIDDHMRRRKTLRQFCFDDAAQIGRGLGTEPKKLRLSEGLRELKKMSMGARSCFRRRVDPASARFKTELSR
jgi:hypothetical protein